MENHNENAVGLQAEVLMQEEQVAGVPVDIQSMKDAASAEHVEAPAAEKPVVAAAQENGTGAQAAQLPAAEIESTATPAAPVSAPVSSTVSPSTVMTPLMKKQLEHCGTILKGMKRHPSAVPFQVPVDPVALQIPDYPIIIKHPMDLSTIQHKMDAILYDNAQQFHDDVKLMLNNCFTYNKPDTQVYAWGKQLERYFDGHWAKLPTELTPAAPAGNDDFGGKMRRKSDAARPRRESAATPRGTAVIPAAPSGRGKRSSPELTFCMATWRELTKKSNQPLAWPFMEPVDAVKLGIPDYPTIIKNPMDLSTMKKKLDAGQYATADEFEADFRLMLQNCYLYNGAESDVARLGRDLEAVFDRKWASKPLPGAVASPAAYNDFDADSEKIIQLNNQIQALQAELNELLMKRQTNKRAAPRPPVPAAPKPKTARTTSEPAAVMSFEEKRQLSMDVNNLSPEKLGRVVEIIHNSMPMLQQQSDSDVIELDIESLDINTLRQLQKYVSECKGIKKRKPSTPAAARPKKAAPMAHANDLAAAPLLEEALSSDDSSSSDDE